MPFSWKAEYSVHIKELDRQHRELVALIDRLDQAIAARTTKAELGPVLHGLASYADVHFRTEEEYFARFKYEHAQEHVKAHDEFRRYVRTLLMIFENDPVRLSDSLIAYLHTWITDHVLVQDQQYVQCFKAHGLQ